jgi:photosystem II stability/assembly factor-like uncharacterized protein
VIAHDRLRRARAIAAEAGFSEDDSDELAVVLTALDAWPTPAVDATRMRAAAHPEDLAAASRYGRVRIRPFGRSALLGLIAAVLLVATAFAASPGVRSTVAGWFGTTTVRLPYILGSAEFVNRHDGWIAVGNVHSGTWRLYRTVNGGRSWQLVLAYPARAVFQKGQYTLPGFDMQFLNAHTGFLLSSHISNHGWRYTLDRTTDGGATWVALDTPPAGPLPIRQFDFVNARDGWTLSDEYTGMGKFSVDLYRTRNGGKDWRRLPFDGEPSFVSFRSPHDGWIMGANMAAGLAIAYRTTDGGLHWFSCIRPPAAVRDLHGCGPPIPHMDVGQGPGTGYFQMLPMDGGDFFGSKGLLPMGISVQHGAVLHYSWYLYRLSHSGLAWTAPERLPLHMGNLQSKSKLNNYSQPVLNISSPIAWYFATPSTLSFTTDGGKHWMYRPSGLPSGYVPDGVRFFGSGAGYLWATKSVGKGAPSSIMEWTTNGGKTWQAITLPAGS